MVVAETFEQARTAAQRVQVKYARAPGAFDLAAAKDSAKPADVLGRQRPTRRSVISPARSPRRTVKVDATYTTPDQSHAMMEPHASIAAWKGDKLTLWTV